MDSSDIENRFTYHAPTGPEQVEVYGMLRSLAKKYAEVINEHCPDSREKSTAITKLEECVFWANAAIARN